jgi:acyl-lipid omega-6 desaturase (Delta-12 desaturase)
MFTVGPLIKFLVIERIVTRPTTTPVRVKRSVHFTNLGVVLFVVGMALLVGPAQYLAVQVPALVIGGSGAIWLFYVQHRFEGAYWSRHRAGSTSTPPSGAAPTSTSAGSSATSPGTSGSTTSTTSTLASRTTTCRAAPGSTPSWRPSTSSRLRESFEARHLKLWDEAAGRYVGYEAAGR